MTDRATVVIVPTFNERENLPVLVNALMQHQNVAVMVVDDASPDGTGDVADALARGYPGRIQVVHRTDRPGLGRSYIDGIRRAIAEPVEVIGQMDADLSHDPAQLPRLIAATADADVVIGSRYIPGGAIANWPRRRRMLSRFANTYIRVVTRATAPAATDAGAARRSRRCRSIGSDPTAIRSWSRCCTSPPASAGVPRKCRLRSSNGALDNRSCRPPCSWNRCSRRGGSSRRGDGNAGRPATTINAELAEPAEKPGLVLRVLRFLR